MRLTSTQEDSLPWLQLDIIQQERAEDANISWELRI